MRAEHIAFPQEGLRQQTPKLGQTAKTRRSFVQCPCSHPGLRSRPALSPALPPALPPTLPQTAAVAAAGCCRRCRRRIVHLVLYI